MLNKELSEIVFWSVKLKEAAEEFACRVTAGRHELEIILEKRPAPINLQKPEYEKEQKQGRVNILADILALEATEEVRKKQEEVEVNQKHENAGFLYCLQQILNLIKAVTEKEEKICYQTNLANLNEWLKERKVKNEIDGLSATVVWLSKKVKLWKESQKNKLSKVKLNKAMPQNDDVIDKQLNELIPQFEDKIDICNIEWPESVWKSLGENLIGKVNYEL